VIAEPIGETLTGNSIDFRVDPRSRLSFMGAAKNLLKRRMPA
jgi:hypothetical protein